MDNKDQHKHLFRGPHLAFVLPLKLPARVTHLQPKPRSFEALYTMAFEVKLLIPSAPDQWCGVVRKPLTSLYVYIDLTY